MFLGLRNRLAALLPAPQQIVNASDLLLTQQRPIEVMDMLEMAWRTPRTPQRAAGFQLASQAQHRAWARDDRLDPLAAPALPNLQAITWPHLIYAAMLEETRIVEIFRALAYQWLHGEQLPRPTQTSLQWLRLTEQVFFTNPLPLWINSVTSTLRPDRDAVRRNAYWRMFGWDLQHGRADGSPFQYVKLGPGNAEFAVVFESLLAEVWRAYSNQNSIAAANETDFVAMAELVRKLREMLTARRLNGALSREEFDAVAVLSWFHMTVDSNNSVIQNLSATSTGIAERLKYLGALVGVAPHARSDAYFQLAEPMSRILIAIESNALNNPVAIPNLFSFPPNAALGAYTNDMLNIITNWSIATGRNIKDPHARRPVPEVMRAIDRVRNTPSAITIQRPTPVAPMLIREGIPGS